MRKPTFYRVCSAAVMLWLLSSCAPKTQTTPSRPASERLPEKSGWIQVRLAGTPREIGFQHGSLLAGEILDAKKAIQLLLQHDTQKDWDFYRNTAREMLWPKIEEEYRQELLGIADGLKSKGFEIDVWDITAMNAWMELGWYYVPEYDKRHGIKTPDTVGAPEHCSAFVATGSYTKDGKVVVAHNAWVDYVIGERWNIVFEITPEHGNRIFMDGFPGLIHSADDFAMNSAGLIVTETTIGAFHGFDPNGIPEFVRARKAVQYAANIDQFDQTMRTGNNGGLANNWLVADRNTGEIASLELGLKNVTLQRKRDGFFAGSNLPENQKLIKEETDFQRQFHRQAHALAATARGKQGQDRRRAGTAVPGRRLRRDPEEAPAQRAHAVRANRPLPARFVDVAEALRAGRRGAEQSDRRVHGGADELRRRVRAPVRPGVPRR